MARSAFEIRMDYNNAIRQADSLSQIAKELKNAASKNMQDCISEISQNWTGNNASAYINKCNTLKKNIMEISDKIEKTAEIIRKIAGNTYNAEMRALELAAIRKY